MIRVTGNSSLLMSSLNTDTDNDTKVVDLLKRVARQRRAAKQPGKRVKNMTVSRSLHPHSKQVQQY